VNVTSDGIVQIRQVTITSREIADQLQGLSEEEQRVLVTRALEVGFFCLNRATIGQSTDFIRAQLEATLGAVDRALLTLPGKVETSLLGKLGTGDGQALAPVHHLVQQVHAVTQSRLDEVKGLLANSLDPARDSSTLGRALRDMQNLLNPHRTDSIQGALQVSLRNMAQVDGPLAKAVQHVVSESIRPLSIELDKLAQEIRTQKVTSEAVSNSPAKGLPFEEEVVRLINSQAMISGMQVSHVGGDSLAGDVVVEVPFLNGNFGGAGDLDDSAILRIAIEVRDRAEPYGRKRISETMQRVMMERNADASIFLSRQQTGLAAEIGNWAEGVCEKGSWVATTRDFLLLSLRFLALQKRIEIAKSGASRDRSSSVDWEGIQLQIQAVRTSLKRGTKITKHLNSMRSSIEAVDAEAKAMKTEISASLSALEDLFPSSKRHGTPRKDS